MTFVPQNKTSPCKRCGYTSHFVKNCRARKHRDGSLLPILADNKKRNQSINVIKNSGITEFEGSYFQNDLDVENMGEISTLHFLGKNDQNLHFLDQKDVINSEINQEFEGDFCSCFLEHNSGFYPEFRTSTPILCQNASESSSISRHFEFCICNGANTTLCAHQGKLCKLADNSFLNESIYFSSSDNLVYQSLNSDLNETQLENPFTQKIRCFCNCNKIHKLGHSFHNTTSENYSMCVRNLNYDQKSCSVIKSSLNSFFYDEFHNEIWRNLRNEILKDLSYLDGVKRLFQHNKNHVETGYVD